MNAIRSVFTALSNLAASLNGMAALVDHAAGRLRQQLALDDAPPAGTILEHHAETNGDNEHANGAGNGKRRKVS